MLQCLLYVNRLKLNHSCHLPSAYVVDDTMNRLHARDRLANYQVIESRVSQDIVCVVCVA